MPLGPRPQPPPVPRKEPLWQPQVQEHPLAVSPPPPPPKLAWDSPGSPYAPQRQGSRLKGPRPLSPTRSLTRPPPLPPFEPMPLQNLPYPVYDSPVGMPRASVLDGDDSPPRLSVSVSSLSLNSPAMATGSSGEFISMPEPDTDSDLLPSPDVAPGVRGPLSFVPPAQLPVNDRPSHSMFRWGIPAELLPPMPVAVESMSGLEASHGGEYTMNLDLPQIPAMEPVHLKFSAEQLTVTELQAPPDVWSLSCLSQWLFYLVSTFDAEFTLDATQQAFTKLFSYRIRDLPWARAEEAARQVLDSLQQQQLIAAPDEVDGALVFRTLQQAPTGVLTLFAGDGCYSPTPTWMVASETACYSSRCLREPRRPIAVSEGAVDPFSPIEMNWRKYWNLDEANIDDVDPKLVKLQFAIHELIMSEELYVRDLEIYLAVYGEIELLEGLSVMNNQKEFSARVFDRIRGVLATNERLLRGMRERQQQEGPYVHDIADLLTTWAQEPDTLAAYTGYAEDYLWAENHLRRELSQNQRLQKWMEERAKDPRLTGRPHSFFFHRVLPRVARYQLLLGAVLKYTPESDAPHRTDVDKAIEATTVLTRECDDRVARQKRLIDVQNLKAHIVFKSSAVTADLKLGDKRRKLIRRGDMQRRGDLKMDWVATHALLLDNFLVLSKTREGKNGTAFYVTKAPIPLDLLVLETRDEDAVVKMTSRLTLTRHGIDEQTQAQANAEGEETAVLWPLRLSHLGSGGRQYHLFVATRPERDHWAQAIIDAKQSRAQLAFARSAEPFRLEKITDALAYPEGDAPQLPVPVPNTPLHRAVGDLDQTPPRPIVLRRRLNCLTPVGSVYLAGTDYGLWLGHGNGEGRWRQVFAAPTRVMKIEVLDTMNVVVVLSSERNLIWYALDQLLARGLGDKRQVLGARLNQQRKVIDFAIAYHKGRVVVTYLQQGGLLKVIEPVRSHGAQAIRAILAQVGLTPDVSCVDYFREIDKLQTTSDSTRVLPLLKSLIFTNAKSFEWATLDTKRPQRVPTGAAPKETQRWGRPLRLFRLDNVRLLLCYEACYVMCDTSGRVGIQPTTWFLEKAVDVAYSAPYLVVFAQGGEMIEIRYVEEFPGRLVQIVTGKDIRLVSNGNDESVHIRMAHPWVKGRQLVLQLVGNDVVHDNVSTWQSSSTT